MLTVVLSKTKDGRDFRPANWMHRLAESGGKLNDNGHMVYAKELRPGKYEGADCLYVDNSLEESNPALFGFVLSFLEENNLRRFSVY